MYLIPFCESVKQSVVGKVNGYFEFVGLKDYLEIAFPSAPTAEVHRITLSGATGDGFVRYAFEKGGIAKNDIAHDSTVANCKALLDAMPELADRGITTTVSAQFDAGTTQDITYDTRAGQVSEEIGLVSALLNSVTTARGVSSVALQTKGKSGFTTGSSYQVEIHLYKYKELCISKNGKITTRDL